jgi:hypothetical protein
MNDDKTLEELVFLRAEVARLRKAVNRLTPGLDTLLKQRGFKIYKKEPAEDLLLPAKKHLPGYYRRLHKYSFRLFLRDVIKRRHGFTQADVTRYATPPVTAEYLAYLISIGLVKSAAGSFRLVKGPVTSFGATLEWYVAELFRREFKSEAVWGVKFRRPEVGGDYDVLAKFDGSLLYVEVKSSPPKQIYDSEVAAFLDRVEDLSPAVAVFLMDTELRMKDKLVPMFEKELKKRYHNPPKVLRMERELFQVRDRIYIVNAKESIIQNFEKVMSRHYRKVWGLQEAAASRRREEP